MDDLDEIKTKLDFCEKLGIKNLILEPKNNKKTISLDLKMKLKALTRINLYYRITLKPSGLKELKNMIRNYNNFKDLLSVETLDKDTHIYAAKDSRVDILSFSEQKSLKTLSRGVISLVKQSGSYIEFSLAPIMIANKSIQSKNFRTLYRSLKLVRNLNVNYIINGNFEDIYDFRHPRALISICYSLLDLPLYEAKKAFKEYHLNLLKRVQGRHNNNIIEAGIRIIKENDKIG